MLLCLPETCDVVVKVSQSKGGCHLDRYSVIVEKQDLQFCSAHFILHKGGREMLHGHNFHCAVILEGDLTTDHYVIDFGDIKAAARQACAALDHRVLLPGTSADIHLVVAEERISVLYGADLLFVFPVGDVRILPLANVTAEQLARYLSGEIVGLLPTAAQQSLQVIEVHVVETPGQRATYRRLLRPA